MIPESPPIQLFTHHRELADHSGGPADVYALIHHGYEERVWVSVHPVERRALRVTHPYAGAVPDVGAELSQRSAVQPEGGGGEGTELTGLSEFTIQDSPKQHRHDGVVRSESPT